jgi:hypothetical protein
VAALLKNKIAIQDHIEIQKTTGLYKGYMLLSEFNLLDRVTGKVFASESVARSYAQGDEIIEVEVVRVFK